MDWSAVGAVGELIGAMAVVASLLYVGRQVQISNTMTRMAAKQEFTAGVAAFTLSVASDRDLAAAFARVHFEDLRRDDATEIERIQIAYALTAFTTQMHFAYDQMTEGILTEQEVDNLFGAGTALMTRPYLASLWPLLRPTYSEQFAVWFERRYRLLDSVETGPEASHPEG